MPYWGTCPVFWAPKASSELTNTCLYSLLSYSQYKYIYIYIYKYTSEKEPAALAAQCVELSPTQVVSLDPEVAGS